MWVVGIEIKLNGTKYYISCQYLSPSSSNAYFLDWPHKLSEDITEKKGNSIRNNRIYEITEELKKNWNSMSTDVKVLAGELANNVEKVLSKHSRVKQQIIKN